MPIIEELSSSAASSGLSPKLNKSLKLDNDESEEGGEFHDACDREPDSKETREGNQADFTEEEVLVSEFSR